MPEEKPSTEINMKGQADVPPLRIAMVAFPGLTLLDLVGPHAVFAMLAEMHVVASTLEPVVGDVGLAILPTTTFSECPRELDVLMVPGGRGTLEAMEDEELLSFLRACAPTTRYITSVCSGSLVLAAAGLLAGYRSTSHWAVHDVLQQFTGVEPVKERVVIDGNRVSGGGVTAGIDFGLTLLNELRGEEVAKLNQLLMEYDPKPPFDAGSPAAAGPGLTQTAQMLMQGFKDAAVAVARRSPAAAEPLPHRATGGLHA